MIRLIVHGARGRMGRRICSLGRADPRCEVIASVPPDDVPTEPRSSDVVIDFSSPSGAVDAAHLAVAQHAALVVGTTGLSPENLGELDEAARSVAVLVAPNMAFGVTVLNHVAAEAARLLGGGFDVTLHETHHAGKRDAPSGTALRLAEVLRERAGREIPASEIGSTREGDVVGEHELIFSGPGEQIRIVHTATTRDVFAAGALRAAAWLAGRPARRYTFEEMALSAASAVSGRQSAAADRIGRGAAEASVRPEAATERPE